MRFYNAPHSYYAGVDLHARSMFLRILARQFGAASSLTLRCH